MKIPPCITLIREKADDQARATEPRTGFLGRLIRSTAETLVRWHPPLQAYSNPILKGLLSLVPGVRGVYDSADRFCESRLKKDDWESVKNGVKR